MVGMARWSLPPKNLPLGRKQFVHAPTLPLVAITPSGHTGCHLPRQCARASPSAHSFSSNPRFAPLPEQDRSIPDCFFRGIAVLSRDRADQNAL